MKDPRRLRRPGRLAVGAAVLGVACAGAVAFADGAEREPSVLPLVAGPLPEPAAAACPPPDPEVVPSGPLPRGAGLPASAPARPAVVRASTGSDGSQFSSADKWHSSGSPMLSADGTKVVFSSSMPGVVPDDEAENGRHLLLKDLGTGELSAVPKAGGRYPASPHFSADGSRVAFVSSACGLAADDTEGSSDVFVRDLTTGKVHRVSVPGAAPVLESVSADATVLATVQLLDVPGSARFASIGIVTDLATGTRTRLEAPGYSDPYHVRVAADGSAVAFSAWSDDGVGSPDQQAFVLDLPTGAVRMVSAAREGEPGSRAGFPSEREPNIDSSTYYPAFDTVLTQVEGISSDGQTVFFTSNAVNLAPPSRPYVTVRHLYAKDLRTGELVRVARNVLDAVVSADGGVVAYLRVRPLPPDVGRPLHRAIAANDPQVAVLEDLRTGRTVELSRNRFMMRGGLSLSADGSRVAFTTRWPVVGDDTNRARDVYVRTVDWGAAR